MAVHDDLFLAEDFLTEAEHGSLLAATAAIPTVADSEWDPRIALAFRRPVYDGIEIRTRSEAAMGEPVWFQNGVVAGVSIPGWLSPVRARVQAAVAATLRRVPVLSSVYLQRYPDGGGFVPHTDRPVYGPVVAGVSLGGGRAVMRFSKGEGEQAANVVLDVLPRSLYAFTGTLRHEPWTHALRITGGERVSITFRSGVSPR